MAVKSFLTNGGVNLSSLQELTDRFGTAVGSYPYTITTNIINGSSSGDTEISQTGTATIIITSDSDYDLPANINDITVTNATKDSYDSTTGYLTINNPTGNVVISATCPPSSPTINPYLTFSSPSTFTIATANSTKNWDGTLYYSTDTENWSIWNGITTINSSSTGDVKYLYIRGSGNHVVTGLGNNKHWTVAGTSVNIEGNIETLLDYQDVENDLHPTLGNYGLRRWMMNNTSIANCSNLILTPENIPIVGYATMFSGCTNLTNAPQIKCKYLNEQGCASMFYNCTSLLEAPDLSSILTVGVNSCSYMFYNCNHMVTGPTELKPTTANEHCYENMFSYCTSLLTPPILRATNYGAYSCRFMFLNCTSLNKLPAINISTVNYFHTESFRGMFKDCPQIKISSTLTGDYQNLYRIPMSGTIYDYPSTSNVMLDMFTGTGGTFTGTPIRMTNYYTSNTIVTAD